MRTRTIARRSRACTALAQTKARYSLSANVSPDTGIKRVQQIWLTTVFHVLVQTVFVLILGLGTRASVFLDGRVPIAPPTSMTARLRSRIATTANVPTADQTRTSANATQAGVGSHVKRTLLTTASTKTGINTPPSRSNLKRRKKAELARMYVCVSSFPLIAQCTGQ